jgi:hypothetical protein
MIQHFHKWTTDWSCNLTEVQIDFIKSNTSLFGIGKDVQDMDDEESDYENEASSSRKISENLCEGLRNKLENLVEENRRIEELIRRSKESIRRLKVRNL